MIDQLTNADAMPVLERMLQFAGQRHRLIVNNIANIDTPGFRPQDVDPAEFQAHLAEAIDDRRAAHGARGGDLALRSGQAFEVTGEQLVLRPDAAGDNLLFHDQNDRDVERIMQGMVENFIAFRAAAQFMRGRLELLNTAISERV